MPKRKADDCSPDRPSTPRPSPPRPPSTPGPRVVFDCVEIITPRARLRSPEHVGLPAGMARLLHPSTPSSRRPRTTQPPPRTPPSPAKSRSRPEATALPTSLSTHLIPGLRRQQRAVLTALRTLQAHGDDDDDDDDDGVNAVTRRQLTDLLLGSVERGEGNSCLLVGPRGSGKTTVRPFLSVHESSYSTVVVQIIEQVVASLPRPPIVVRLSGHAQHNDRLALRQLARQLSQQTGASFVGDDDDDQDCNPFVDAPSLPPPSHLPALVSLLPTLARPVLVVLDAFDLFAQHARQSLLYCLLDTVQSCHVGRGNNGVAVVGATSRLDTVNLLEKRVKSRFSGRVLRTAPPLTSGDWMALTETVLSTPIENADEWSQLWTVAVDRFLADRKVVEAFADTFALTRDVSMLQRILVSQPSTRACGVG